VSEQNHSKGGVSRRELIRTTAVTGAAGLLVGGAGGYAAGSSGTDEAGSSAGAGGKGGPDIRLVVVNFGTGIFAGDGEEARNGSAMAIDEINQLGGVLGRKLKYVEVDQGGSTAEEVRSAFTRAVQQENPDVVIYPFAQGMGPDLEVLADAGMLAIHGNTRDDFTKAYQRDPKRYWSIFQADPGESAYGKGFARFITDIMAAGKFDPPNGKTAAIISGDDPYGSAIAKSFEDAITKLGWKITTKDLVTSGTISDWGPIMSKIRRNPPSVVFSSNFAPGDMAALAKQWTANPVNAIVNLHNAPSRPDFGPAAGPAANGMLWTTVLGTQWDTIGQEFRAKYRKRFNKEPTPQYTGGMYDMIWLWAKAAAMAGDVRDWRKIASLLEKTTGAHRGVTGGMSFVDHTVPSYPSQTDDPSLGQPHIVGQYQDGENKVVWPFEYANAEFQLPSWIKG
jgi:branched-chain amino acid transport system substrate-binding protein